MMHDVTLQVAVLVEMPTLRAHMRRQGVSEYEQGNEGIPDLAFGIAEVPWRTALHGEEEDEECLRPSALT